MSQQSTTTLDLDKPQHQKIQSWEWTAERVGWLLIAISLAAALLGLLGPGPLSHRLRSSSNNRLSVEYYWLQRYDAPTELRIRTESATQDRDTLQIALSRKFTDEVALLRVTPEPMLEKLVDHGIQYSFRRAEVERDGVIVFRYHNSNFGSLDYEITQDDGARIKVSQFVFP